MTTGVPAGAGAGPHVLSHQVQHQLFSLQAHNCTDKVKIVNVSVSDPDSVNPDTIQIQSGSGYRPRFVIEKKIFIDKHRHIHYRMSS